MSYERLEDAINALFLAEKTLKDNKSLFEQYITDPSISLDKRWDFWTLAPDSLKKTNGWISDGRFEAFKILGWEQRTCIGYDGPLYAERYETLTTEGILESVMESFPENYEDWPEGFDFDNFSWDEDELFKLIPQLGEFVLAFKEEVLQKNIHSFKYDW